MQQLKYLRY